MTFSPEVEFYLRSRNFGAASRRAGGRVITCGPGRWSFRVPQLLHALQRQRSTPPDQLDPRVTGWRSACQCGWRGTQPSGRCRTLVQLRPRVCRATSPVTRSLSGDGQVRCGEKHPSPRACAPRAKIGPSRTARRGGIPSRASAGAGRRGHHHDMQCTLDSARSRDRAGGAPRGLPPAGDHGPTPCVEVGLPKVRAKPFVWSALWRDVAVVLVGRRSKSSPVCPSRPHATTARACEPKPTLVRWPIMRVAFPLGSTDEGRPGGNGCGRRSV